MPGPARRLVLEEDDDEGDRGREAADDREERPVDPADAEARPRPAEPLLLLAGSIRSRMIDACATVNENVAPNE